jgi:hypothetical protein
VFQKNAEREPAKAQAWPDDVVYNPLRRFCAAIRIIRKLIAANSLILFVLIAFGAFSSYARFPPCRRMISLE